MKPTKRIAVLIETSRAYGRGLLRGVTRFHQEAKTWSIFFKPQDLGASLPRWLKNWNGDGILARVNSSKMAKDVMATGLPFIDLRGASHGAGSPAFGPDTASICRLAFDHLYARGVRQVAFVGEPVGFHVYDDERRASFQALAQEHGIDCHIFQHARKPREAQSWEAQQKRLTLWLAGLPKPIGIMAVHDDRGMQVLDACRDLGLAVPDEVAVIGVDNDEFLCNLAIPSLSSVDPNSERIGYEAARLLDSLVDRQARFDEPRHFPPIGIVARQSTDLLMARDRDITEAIRYIRQHACQRITVGDVERHVAMSRSLLNRRFKQLVGRTPKAEIVHVQIDKAKQLLADTDLPVAKIATLTGFSESKYFIYVFDRHLGVTPRTFRVQQGRFNGLGDNSKEAEPRPQATNA